MDREGIKEGKVFQTKIKQTGVSPYLSIIMNENGLNSSIKRLRLAEDI